MKKTILPVLAGLLLSTIAFGQKTAIQNAYAALGRGELDEAKTEIESAIKDESTKDDPKAWVYRGKIYWAMAEAIMKDSSRMRMEAVPMVQNMQTAQESYVKASSLDVKNKFDGDIQTGLSTIAYIKFNIAVPPYNQGMYQPSYILFKDVSNIYGFLKKKYNFEYSDTAALPYAAYSALQIKQYDTAMLFYKRLYDMNYRKTVIYQGLEQSALGLKDTVGALKFIEEGRAADPEANSLMFDELNIYLAQNKTDVVLSKLKEAIAKNPANSSELNFVLGNKYDLALHDTANAVKYYTEAIRLKPDYKEAYFSMGVMFFNIAVDVVDQMNKVPTNDQKKYDELNAINFKLLNRAQPFLEKAYELDPKDRDTLTGLKQLYTRKDMIDKANQIEKELKALGK